MFILITVGILLLAASALTLLQIFLPDNRYSWLIATGGSLLGWASVLAWLSNMPIRFEFSIWRPVSLFSQSPAFLADGISWAYSLSITALSLAIIITSVVRANFPSPFNWTGTLLLASLGILAVVADNALTLVLIWAALDLVELTIQLRFVEDPKLSERVVIAFASRVGGTLLVLWAGILTAANGQALDFHTEAPQAGLYLLIAAALRLGVLPLHLPYPSESAIRRGFGTGLRMISAASSLILLARIPSGSIPSSLLPILSVFVGIAAFYGGWMWLRSSDELSGRPYWMIGMASLSVAAALRANPAGAAAWGCALILSGGALFLSSEPNKWLVRILWVSAFGISALPFSLTAAGWITNNETFLIAGMPLVLAQAFLLGGFIRQIQKPIASRAAHQDQPIWARNIYPVGIGILLITSIGLGLFGWNGAPQLGILIAGIFASLLTAGLIWATPRFRILNPVRAHWVTPTDSWLDRVYQLFWNSYRQLGRLSNIFTNILEGEGGIMWTMLFLALFVSFISQRGP